MDLFLLVEKYTGSPTPVVINETQSHIYTLRSSFVPLHDNLPVDLTTLEMLKNSVKNTSFRLGKREVYIAPEILPEPPKSAARFKTPKFSIEPRQVSEHPPEIKPRESLRPSIKLPVTNLHRIESPEPPTLPPVIIKTIKVKPPPVVEEVIPVPELVRPNYKALELNLQRIPSSDRRHYEEEEEVDIPELVRPNYKIPELNLQRIPSSDRTHYEEEVEIPGVIRPDVTRSLLKIIKPVRPEVPPEGTTHIPVLPDLKLSLKIPELKLHRKVYGHEETTHVQEETELLPELPLPPPEPVPVSELYDINALLELAPTHNEDANNHHTMHSQKLECIALLTTTFEIENGRVEEFFKRLQLSETYNLDFIVFLNKKASIPGLDIIAQHFNNVFVVSTEISEKDDVRVDDGKGLKYGACSGPNILFLKSMKFCERYSTTLVLETDCFLQPSWLDRCINYVEYSGSFIIAGSHYHGKIQLNSNDTSLFKHINGVAFYNTSSQYFKTLMDTTDLFIRSEAQRGISHAYDVAIYECILKFIRSSKNVPYWTYIHHNINTTTLIVNISLPIDASTPISEVLEKFPKAVIIHKKD